MVSPPCMHGIRKNRCKLCSPTCQHGKTKGQCSICSGCKHGKRKDKCRLCTPKEKLCPHLNKPSICKECIFIRSGVAQEKTRIAQEVAHEFLVLWLRNKRVFLRNQELAKKVETLAKEQNVKGLSFVRAQPNGDEDGDPPIVDITLTAEVRGTA